MKRFALWLVLATFTGAATFFAAAWATPRVIMWVAMDRLADFGGVNRMVHAPPPTHESRTVVRPSPDPAYSICVYDLSDGPIRVVADFPEGVNWSISAYADNTDNFFVANDRTAGAPPQRYVFGLEPLGREVVVSPSARGVILMRYHLADPEAITRIDARRANSACQPLSRRAAGSG